MYIKLAGAVCIFVSSYLLGFYFNNMSRRRLSQLGEFKKALTLLKNEISFALTPLPEAFKCISAKVEQPVRGMLELAGDSLTKQSKPSFGEIWGNMIKVYAPKTALSSEDCAALAGLGGTMGLLDKNAQLSAIDLTIEYINETAIQLTKKRDKNGNLYQNLGMLVGVLIIIMLM